LEFIIGLPILTQGEIIFKDVSFGYNEGKLHTLKNLNLHIKAGEKIGLVGSSGAGKSTLISLLLKNFQTTKGDILIDNQSIYDISSDSLRSQIALIPQDTLLFHRSIGENIGYAKDSTTQTEIENAAKKAHIHEFITTLPNGYDTLVGERGIKLSGGQRQRIAIARAILKDAPILILDEATSSLDSHTEHYIQESLNLLIGDKSKTVIAIAHRLSTLKHMDRIIVLDKGRIIEDGTHDQLLKNQGYYQTMWDMQSGGFLPESLEE
jgi:ATP-binding cassette subfamily B protein